MLKVGTSQSKFRMNTTNRTKILDADVHWGFGALSAAVFYRTYSRVKEDGAMESWNDCVIRVIEGMFTILKTHSKESGISWDERKAQRLAIEAAERMFTFKWTPPGRGLWVMGTDLIWDRGSAALNNCGFVSTKDISQDSVEDTIEPFEFLVSMSFYGVGVGFDTKGAGKVRIAGFDDTAAPVTFVVPDTREGWVEAMMLQLRNGIFNGPRVEFDTSLIRKQGTPIKGFGGEAPGPMPLVHAVNAIQWVVDRDKDSLITSAFIVDIQNITGRAIVSGGIRRVAEIALAPDKDELFKQLKNPELYPIEMGAVPPSELKDIDPAAYENYWADIDKIVEKYKHEPWAFKFGGWRWASNNSVYGEIGKTDYTKIEDDIKLNGEPGLHWLELCRQYGRFKDPIDNKDYRAAGTNPCCFSGDTLIECKIDGKEPQKIRISDVVVLHERGREVLVKAKTIDTDEVSWDKVTYAGLTRPDTKVLRITDTTNNKTIVVTPDHLLWTKNRGWVEAASLEKDDVLDID